MDEIERIDPMIVNLPTGFADPYNGKAWEGRKSRNGNISFRPVTQYPDARIVLSDGGYLYLTYYPKKAGKAAVTSDPAPKAAPKRRAAKAAQVVPPAPDTEDAKVARLVAMLKELGLV